MDILYHYTSAEGLRAILADGTLLPSTSASSPSDVRYGNGQYLTDILPGTMSSAQLSRALIGHPFAGQRFTHFVAIDVTGLNVVPGRPGVSVVPNEDSLPIAQRIVRSGAN